MVSGGVKGEEKRDKGIDIERFEADFFSMYNKALAVTNLENFIYR